MELRAIHEHAKRVRTDLRLPQPLGRDIQSLTGAFDNVSISIAFGDWDPIFDQRIVKEGDHYVIRLAKEHEGLTRPESVFEVTKMFGHILLGHVDHRAEEFSWGRQALESDAIDWALDMLMPRGDYRSQLNQHADGGSCGHQGGRQSLQRSCTSRARLWAYQP